MELRVNRIEFLKKLKTVEKAINENKIKPIISYAYVETIENGLKFYGTNLEITIITRMDAEIKEPGKILFQHQIVEEYLKELNDETVILKIADSILTIETEDSSTEFSTFDAEEFPKNYLSTEIKDENLNFDIQSQELVEIFEKTKFAASQSSDDMRINCIRIDSDSSKMRFVGTDTYRLVYLEKEIVSNGEFSISLPLNTVDSITKLFKILDNSSVKVSVGTKNIKFEINETLVVSRIIDLPYPDYLGILEKLNYNKKLKLNTQDFFNMLKRVIIFVRSNSDSKFGAIFEIADGKLIINGSNENAKIKEENEVEYIGEGIRISLNTKFLIDFIQNISTEKKLIVEFINSNGSVKVTEENQNNYIYVVMPLALRQ